MTKRRSKNSQSFLVDTFEKFKNGYIDFQSKDYQVFMKTQGMNNPVRQKPNKRLYSLKEASEYLGRGIWAIRRMIWNGEIAYVKAGRRVLLDIKEMDSWVEKNKTQFTY